MLVVKDFNQSFSSEITIEILDNEGEPTYTFYSIELDYSNKFLLLCIILNNNCQHLIVKSTCGNMYKGRNCSKDSLCTVSGDGRSIIGCDCVNGYHGSGFVCIGNHHNYYYYYKLVYVSL